MPVIGHGDIGSILTDREGFTFFASGVSNSSETRFCEYFRETDLLLEQDRGKRLVYFSSLSIYYKESHYTRHKIAMERIIKDEFKNYCIVRLGNITWGSNPNTIINYFQTKINNNEQVKLEDGYRFLVSKDEFTYWMGLIPNFNTEMNIPGERVEIKKLYERIKRNSRTDDF